MVMLPYSETCKMLAKYRIQQPVSKLVKSKSEALSFAAKAGYPLVMKVNSKKIIHKTDVNGVKMGIKSKKELKDCYEEMAYRFKHMESDGFILQKMYEGHQVIIGMKRDRQFGPVIMFGFGGIFVEIIKDVSYRIAPISIQEAEEMIREIKLFRALEGSRNGVKADIRKIADIIVKVSKLAMQNNDVFELDLNPVIVNEMEAIAVDARIIR